MSKGGPRHPRRRGGRKWLSILVSKKVLRVAVLLSCVCSLFVTFVLLDSTERRYDVPQIEVKESEPPKFEHLLRDSREREAVEASSTGIEEDDGGDHSEMAETVGEDERESAGNEGADEVDAVGSDAGPEDTEEDLQPIVLTIEPYHGSAMGGTLLTIKGHNLAGIANLAGNDGEGDSEVYATVGGAPCLSTVALDSQVLTCVTPPGSGRKRSVAVVREDQGSKVESPPNTLFNYDDPEVEGVSPAVGQSSGGTLVTLRGRNFGSGEDDLVEIFVGESNCTRVRRVSDGEATCATPAQATGIKNVSMSVGAGIHRSVSVPRPLYEYALTPMEKLREQSKALLDGLTVNFEETALVFNQNANFEGNECVDRDVLTGKPLVYTMIPALREVLPKYDLARKRHSTCALVFNSVRTGGERHGETIDSADAVFRINNAPTRTHEALVGSKTTYRFAQTKFLRSLLVRDPEVRPRAPRLAKDNPILVATSPASQDFYVLLRMTFPSAEIYYVSSAFSANAAALYAELQTRFLELGFGGVGEEGVRAPGDGGGGGEDLGGNLTTARSSPRSSVASRGRRGRAAGRTDQWILEKLREDAEPRRESVDLPLATTCVLFAIQLCGVVNVYGLRQGRSEGAGAPYFGMGEGEDGGGATVFGMDDGRATDGPKTDHEARVEAIDDLVIRLLMVENHVKIVS